MTFHCTVTNLNTFLLKVGNPPGTCCFPGKSEIGKCILARFPEVEKKKDFKAIN